MTAVLVFIASISSALGIAVVPLSLLAILGLAGFFYCLWHRIQNYRGAFWYGLLYGTFTGSAGIFWFWDTLPLDSIGIQNPLVSITAVSMTWLYVSFAMGIGIGLTSMALFAFRRFTVAPLVAALLWPIGEQLRAWGFALFTWGPGASFAPHFSAASIGYPLAENSYLLQLAYPFGLPVLEAFAALLAGTLVVLPELKKASLRPKIALTTLALILFIPLFSPYHPPKDTTSVHVALLSTRVAAQDTPIPIRGLIAEAATQNPDIVLVPETLGLGRSFSSTTAEEAFVQKSFGTHEALLVSSAYETDGSGNRREKLSYASTKTGTIASYDKIFLMPVGEFVPAFATTFYHFLGSDSLNHLTDRKNAKSVAGDHTAVASYHGLTVGALMCSELFSPFLYKDLTQKDAQLLVNISNQSWFHGSWFLYVKTLEVAKVQAVTARKWFAFAGNDAASFVLDPTGTIVTQAHNGASTVLYADIPLIVTPAPSSP